jgi:hypothetical protein
MDNGIFERIAVFASTNPSPPSSNGFLWRGDAVINAAQFDGNDYRYDSIFVVMFG